MSVIGFVLFDRQRELFPHAGPSGSIPGIVELESYPLAEIVFIQAGNDMILMGKAFERVIPQRRERIVVGCVVGMRVLL
ncbi:MAG: hypothetical protein IKO51_10455 [Clostridia bacterium]|nr:hypothetical protein [Clostridia bacterium]